MAEVKTAKEAGREHRNKIILGLVLLLLLVIALLQEPFPQPQSYHLFADSRSWLGIPNTLDVLSNIPFAIVGLWGLLSCGRCRAAGYTQIFPVIFAGIFLTAFGSAYYHWQPDNQSLVWDRLPMTIAFMGFFTYVLTDRVDLGYRVLLWPLLAVGAASVFYWGWTESRGVGDLRFYGLVQFGPLLLTPLILILFPGRTHDLKYYAGLIAGYALAKLLEHFDQAVWEFTGAVSGHSLKHLAAAVGSSFILPLMRQTAQSPVVIK